MTPSRLRELLDHLHWSQRGLAEVLACDDRLVRRWATGQASVPPEVADWLERLSEALARLPPPEAWRRRAA